MLLCVPLFTEALMLKFSQGLHHNHIPHLDRAEFVLLVFLVASIAVAVSFDWIYRALMI